MSKAKEFSDPIPDGYQIYERRLEVAGVHYKKDEATKFGSGSRQAIEFEREQDNRYDPNAIKIIGVSKGLFLTSRNCIGYVPKEVSKKILGSNLLGAIRPRLNRIHLDDKGFIEIQFQIIGPKETKEQYDGFLKNKPVNQWQKEFFKFFGIKAPKGLTSGQAGQKIKESRKIYEVEDKEKLDEWDAYEELYDEFDDSEFRDEYDIKKVSLSLLRDALNKLNNDGESMRSLADDIDKVVDKIIEIKPEIERK